MTEQTQQPAANPTNSDATESTTGLTPQLVQQITDKVYALLQRDLQLERERAWLTRPSARWRL